jgi:4'-phosphopantetheinyl transferase EntD
VIERLLPPEAVGLDTRAEIEGAELFPEEERAIRAPAPAAEGSAGAARGREPRGGTPTWAAAASARRRSELASGRALARAALALLGLPASPIPAGKRGEPLWPAGVVGSITHCRGYRACALAPSSALTALGIDAEPDAPLPERVLRRLASGREIDVIAAARERAVGLTRPRGEPPALDRLLFCVKEAAYKAWYPLGRGPLGLDAVELCALDVDAEGDGGETGAGGTLSVRVPDPAGGRARARGEEGGRSPEHRPSITLGGRWCAADGLLCVAVWAPADRAPAADAGGGPRRLR